MVPKEAEGKENMAVIFLVVLVFVLLLFVFVLVPIAGFIAHRIRKKINDSR